MEGVVNHTRQVVVKVIAVDHTYAKKMADGFYAVLLAGVIACAGLTFLMSLHE